MKVFVSKDEESEVVFLLARVESEEKTEGGSPVMLGDVSREIRPGEDAFGKSYEEWVSAESPVEIS